MKTEELKRLAEAVLKAYSGLSWQVTMVRNEYGVTHYHIRSHSEPGIAVIKDQYWEDDHIPPVDHYGYIQPDDHIDCDVFRVNIARLIAAANPSAILELIQQRDELLAALKDARELVDDWGAYATAYMQEKHDLAGDIERLDAAISKVEG
jgi:hypothetical protein